MESKLTPMMKQYHEIKKKHQNDILFFRMGDFYEMFFEDAKLASKVLDIALTSRQNDIPMCGLPYHAAESYIARLIKAGYRVAICEQMEQVPSSGTVVRRDVIRIITPGTVIESNLLQSDDFNFLGSVVVGPNSIGMGFADLSTGDFFIATTSKTMDMFRGNISRFNPREILFREHNEGDDSVYSEFIRQKGISLARTHKWYYDTDYLSDTIKDIYGTASLKGLGLEDPVEILAAGALLHYLQDTQRSALGHLKHPRRLVTSDYMVLDDQTITNLEIIENQQERSRSRTLFSVLNYTKTAMGRRTLEHILLHPLLDMKRIQDRLDSVQYFHEYHQLTDTMQQHLAGIHDIERLVSRFSLKRFFPRDFLSLAHSIHSVSAIAQLLKKQPVSIMPELQQVDGRLAELAHDIETTMVDEPPLSPEQGRVIREGVSDELDRLHSLKADAKQWILEYQEDEKKKLGIPTLKIRYNRVLGYYIEISKGQSGKVPDDYFRKQTLVGSERYTTESLQKFESDIVTASERIVEMEKELMDALYSRVIALREPLQQLAAHVGKLDCFTSFASAAIEQRFIRPSISLEGTTRITNGRHPVVEKYYTREVFIPNDIMLDDTENTVKIITGPNMSGKSTYIRMAAIIQLMAQVGSFVPADEAEICLADRIFTRIGASDNIARGESTFLVEMNETALILNNATDKSLIIMDEIGRGTSTYDGMSIAWAVVEYIQRYLKAKTLFATHYHELTKLGNRKGIKNYNVMVKDSINGIEFLHKVVPGAADKSYGIHVAQLAGVPARVTSSAGKILEKMEKNRKTEVLEKEDSSSQQLDIFNAANHRVVQAISQIDIDRLTPIDAINELHRLKKLIDM
ncbi:MAG: DNA mismatch repair protein MutS [Spirochaetota bacterium]